MRLPLFLQRFPYSYRSFMCQERLLVFSKRSWIKISHESVSASTKTTWRFLFFFFFLWNLTNENRSFVFVEKSSINDSVRRKAGRRQCSFSRVFDPVRIFAYYTRNSDAALRCISFFAVNVLCEQRDKIRVCTLVDIYVTFVVFRILRIFSACHGTLLYVKPLCSFDRLNHPNPAFGFRTKIMAGKVPINDCTKSATCVRDALLDIESISRIFQALVEQFYDIYFMGTLIYNPNV